MARYRKKPVEVEAFLFGVDNMPDWFMDKVTSKDVVLHRIPFDEARARNYGQMWCDIKTLEGTVRAYEGKDYIIRGVKGEIYPCKADIFEETYEIPTADVVPKSEIESKYGYIHTYTGGHPDPVGDPGVMGWTGCTGCAKNHEVAKIFKEILTIIRSYEFDALVAKENYGIILVRNFGTDILKLKKKYTGEKDDG